MKKLIFSVVVLLVSSCVNMGGGPYRVNGKNAGSNGASYGDDQASASDFVCPTEPNVKPQVDVYHDGSEFYSVCKHETSPSDVLVYGKTKFSDSICLFPVKALADGSAQIYYAQSTGVIYQCKKIPDAGGVFAHFDDIEYNYLFIVEKGFESQMAACLYWQDRSMCPTHYSEGRFADY